MSEEISTAAHEVLANDAMHLRIGQAIGKWGYVESTLATWFQRLTNMHPITARRVFYSVTGFDARRRMFVAAVRSAASKPDISEYLIALINKAGKYAGTRNQIVHGDMLFIEYAGSKHCGTSIILQGRQHWVADPPDSEVLTTENLEIARDNFGTLALYSAAGLNWDGSPEKSPLRFLEQIRELPVPAHSSRLSQTIAARAPVAESDIRQWWR
jgi:hypothetical protein